MFGTELHLITFLFILFEFVIFAIQFAVFLSRPKDNKRVRFFILTLLFIIYNLCSGLFPDSNFGIHLLMQNILAFGSGITLGTYYFYYLVKELNIQKDRFFNTKFLFLSLLFSFVIGFIITYLLTGDLVTSKLTFIVFPVLIAIYFCYRTVAFILKNQEQKRRHGTHHKLMTLSGYLGIIFMSTMPIVVLIGDYQSINIALVNTSFVLSAVAFYKNQLYQSRLEYNALNEIGYFSKNKKVELLIPLIEPFLELGLTPKETEISQLLLDDLSYREISEVMFIAEKTVSKHASNIFKKAECSNKKEFMNKYALTNS